MERVKHLGMRLTKWGGAIFRWDGSGPARPNAYTVWSVFPENTEYFGPGATRFMINYQVANLDRMLAQLRKAGVAVEDKIEASEFGRFGWATDPEGHRFELWEPPKPRAKPKRKPKAAATKRKPVKAKRR
jgi:catechol 2,3-dioxygenase-like lactoylglutathione lyase family enzyme